MDITDIRNRMRLATGETLSIDPVQLRNRIRRAMVSDRQFLDRRYEKAFGRRPDLENPKRWTEILTWQMLNSRNPLMTRCADKLAVRGFVEEKLGPEILVPLLASGDRWSDLDFASLDEPFIIKTSHGSGAHQIVLDKSEVDEAALRRRFTRYLKRNHYVGTGEWQYKDIKPRLLIERLLQDADGRVPADYKFHCFNYGDSIEVITLVIADRYGDKSIARFDESWNRLDYECVTGPPEDPPPRPAFMDELLATAKRLAADFCYVRVDLYWANDQAYFGELTFTPDAGQRPIVPDEWDFILGDKLLRTGMLKTATEHR